MVFYLIQLNMSLILDSKKNQVYFSTFQAFFHIPHIEISL
jgi:hypothetical protein